MIRPFLVLAAADLAVALLTAQLLLPPAPALIWNASPSAPIGLYRIARNVRIGPGDLVAITPPEPLAGFLSANGYLPRGLPLLKQVAAANGQRVCRAGGQITVDGSPRALALARDRRGRALPSWSGCVGLGAGEVFLLNTPADSLDSRYFGPLPVSSVIGVAHPLWLERRL